MAETSSSAEGRDSRCTLSCSLSMSALTVGPGTELSAELQLSLGLWLASTARAASRRPAQWQVRERQAVDIWVASWQSARVRWEAVPAAALPSCTALCKPECG